MTAPDALVTTRRSLHAIAEHVLAAALHSSTGRIGLRAAPGGFATPEFPGPDGPRRVGIDGTDLVVTDAAGTRRTALTTVGAAAAFVGVRPGAPADVYEPATPLEPDRPLALDPDAALRLADFFDTVDQALARLVAEADAPRDDGTAPVQLWPEHFDLATTIAEVNYGGSPGDDEHPQPYLYVGPWERPESTEPFWNEPFGASVAAPPDLDATAAWDFFDDGRSRLGR